MGRRALIATGKLKRVLPAWRLEPAPVMALTPTRQGLTIRQRVFSKPRSERSIPFRGAVEASARATTELCPDSNNGHPKQHLHQADALQSSFAASSSMVR